MTETSPSVVVGDPVVRDGTGPVKPSTGHGRVTLEGVKDAFDTMGRYLAERGKLGEIAVYGGTAIMLQFGWRRSTQDVDAVVREGDEGDVREAALYAAVRHSLPDDWINDAVGAFTPERERPFFFDAFASYPPDGPVGLKVCLARPGYLCAMKIAALERSEDRDFDDAVRLARAAGISTEDGLRDLYASFFPDERLPRMAAERMASVALAVGAPA